MSNENAPMTVDRVLELIDAYGAAPGHWPDAERDAAEALLAGSPALQAHARAAAALDHMLDAATLPEMPASLAETVHAMAPAPQRLATHTTTNAAPSGLLAALLPRLRPAALALATVLGLALGYSGLFAERGGPGWESLDASLVAGGSQMVGVSYFMEDNR